MWKASISTRIQLALCQAKSYLDKHYGTCEARKPGHPSPNGHMLLAPFRRSEVKKRRRSKKSTKSSACRSWQLFRKVYFCQRFGDLDHFRSPLEFPLQNGWGNWRKLLFRVCRSRSRKKMLEIFGTYFVACDNPWKFLTSRSVSRQKMVCFKTWDS